MTPWFSDPAAPDRSLQQKRAQTLERSAAFIRAFIAVVTIPLILVFQSQHILVLSILIGGLALFSVFAAWLARRMPDSYVAANVGWPVALGVSLAVVAITGGAHSPLWIVLIFPILGAVARFRGFTSAAGVLLTAAGGIGIIIATPGVSFDDSVMYGFGLTVIGLSLWMFGEQDMKAHEEAVLDPLTELFNRHHLNGRLQELDITLTRAGGQVSVIAADLDFFKQVNDEYGHARGDAVLKEVAYIMRESIRNTDVAFRAGGEEFVLILPGANVDVAKSIAERVRETVQRQRPGNLDVTISCGVASATANDNIDMDSLLQQADAALYIAKRGGRNKVCVADEKTVVPDKSDAQEAKPSLRVA